MGHASLCSVSTAVATGCRRWPDFCRFIRIRERLAFALALQISLTPFIRVYTLRRDGFHMLLFLYHLSFACTPVNAAVVGSKDALFFRIES